MQCVPLPLCPAGAPMTVILTSSLILKLVLMNARSNNNKTTRIHDFIMDEELDTSLAEQQVFPWPRFRNWTPTLDEGCGEVA